MPKKLTWQLQSGDRVHIKLTKLAGGSETGWGRAASRAESWQVATVAGSFTDRYARDWRLPMHVEVVTDAGRHYYGNFGERSPWILEGANAP